MIVLDRGWSRDTCWSRARWSPITFRVRVQVRVRFVTSVSSVRGGWVWTFLVNLVEGVVVNVAQVGNALAATHDGTVANLKKCVQLLANWFIRNNWDEHREHRSKMGYLIWLFLNKFPQSLTILKHSKRSVTFGSEHVWQLHFYYHRVTIGVLIQFQQSGSLLEVHRRGEYQSFVI